MNGTILSFCCLLSAFFVSVSSNLQGSKLKETPGAVHGGGGYGHGGVVGYEHGGGGGYGHGGGSGGYGHGGDYGGGHRGFGGGHYESSACSVHASYYLSQNYEGENRFCSDTALESWNSCFYCCISATRRDYNSVDKEDVTGFITIEKTTGNKECICCVPKRYGHYYGW